MSLRALYLSGLQDVSKQDPLAQRALRYSGKDAGTYRRPKLTGLLQ